MSSKFYSHQTDLSLFSSAMTTLQDKTIAVPESRELDVFAALLERRGAKVWRCPLVAIVDARDPAPVLRWVRTVVAGSLDDLILLTGEGLRRLISCMEQHDPSLRAPFVAALSQLRIITRGPKPVRALKELGLASSVAASTPTTAGVIATLQAVDIRGRTVGVQLYGTDPNRPLIDYLTTAGATPLPVSPYEYADASADSEVEALLQALQSGRIDAIAFTSKSQLERLCTVAGLERTRHALSQTLVAAIGPVVAEALRQRGVQVDAMPQSSWFMKPMATELVALFTDTSGAESQ
jgi:uroporphyrinogen-III synthase